MARRGVLAQQLNAIESLASVDVVCTDKTGTLTEASLRVVDARPRRRRDQRRARAGARRATPPARRAQRDARGDRRRADWRDADARRVAAQVPFSLAAALERARPRRREARARRARALRRRRLGAAPRGRARRPAPAAACWRSAAPRRRCPPPRRTPRARRVQPLGLVVLAERLRPERGRDGRLLRRGGRRAEGALRRRARRPSPRSPATRACPGRRPRWTASALPDDPARAARGRRWPRPPSAASRPRASAASSRRSPSRPLRGDGRRRRQRRARAQGGAAGDRAGQRRADGPPVADLVLVTGDFAAVPRMVREGRQILRNIQRVASCS